MFGHERESAGLARGTLESRFLLGGLWFSLIAL